MKKIIMVLLLLVLSSSVYAAVMIRCPNLNEIRAGNFHGWLPLYVDSEELASDKDVEAFKAFVTSFDVARWNADYLESGHCYYHGNRGLVEKITFVHATNRPAKDAGWYWVKPGKLAECKMGPRNCRFKY